MRQMNLRISLAISLFVIFLMVHLMAIACPPSQTYYPPVVNPCGAYGCVNGRPAVVIPGYPNGGPYPPPPPVTTTNTNTTTIIIHK
jgi:hypothetical protein